MRSGKRRTVGGSHSIGRWLQPARTVHGLRLDKLSLFPVVFWITAWASAIALGTLGLTHQSIGGGAYRNCAAARAAGAAPVLKGSRGYGLHLDRDRDGVGCEPWRR